MRAFIYLSQFQLKIKYRLKKQYIISNTYLDCLLLLLLKQILMS